MLSVKLHNSMHNYASKDGGTSTPQGFESRMVLLLRLGDSGRTCLFRILFNCGMVAALGGNIVQLLDWHAVFFIFYVPTSSTTL